MQEQQPKPWDRPGSRIPESAGEREILHEQYGLHLVTNVGMKDQGADDAETRQQ